MYWCFYWVWLLLWSDENLSYAMYLHKRCNTLSFHVSMRIGFAPVMLLFFIYLLSADVFDDCTFLFFSPCPIPCKVDGAVLVWIGLGSCEDDAENVAMSHCYSVFVDLSKNRCIAFFGYLGAFWVSDMMCCWFIFVWRVVHTLHTLISLALLVWWLPSSHWRLVRGQTVTSLPNSISLVLQLGCDTSSPLPIGGATSTQRAQCTITIHKFDDDDDDDDDIQWLVLSGFGLLAHFIMRKLVEIFFLIFPPTFKNNDLW